MGYDFHITRREYWFDEGEEIALEEFVGYVRDDGEFRYPGVNGDRFADWRSPKSGYESWLSWGNGQINTKNPAPEFIDKMVAIAQRLRAKVQGDEGEIYLSATEILDEGEESFVASRVRAGGFALQQWPLWKKLIAAFLLGCVLLVLKLLIFGG